MAADRDTLKNELRKFCDPTYGGFEGFPLTREAAIDRLTAAYHAYGQTNEDLSTDALVSGDTVGFDGQLTGQMIGNGMTWYNGADALADAWEVYYAPPTPATFGTSAPCPAGGECENVPAQDMVSEKSSAVTVVVGQSEVRTRLYAMFQNPGGSLGGPEDWLEQLADCFHLETIEMGNINIHIDGLGAGGPPPPPITND